MAGGNATGDEGEKHRRLLFGNFFGSRVFRAPVLHASARSQHARDASRFHPHNYGETYLDIRRWGQRSGCGTGRYSEGQTNPWHAVGATTCRASATLSQELERLHQYAIRWWIKRRKDRDVPRLVSFEHVKRG